MAVRTIVSRGWSHYHAAAIERYDDGEVVKATSYEKGDDGFITAYFGAVVCPLEIPNTKLQEDGTIKVHPISRPKTWATEV